MSERRHPAQPTANSQRPSSWIPPPLALDVAAQPSGRESTPPATTSLGPPGFEARANPASFALSVDVDCSPIAEARDLLAICTEASGQPGQPPSSAPAEPTARNVTSVSLSLRPAGHESQRQPPPSIGIRSQGPIAYSSGFRSQLRISIGRGERSRAPPRRPSGLGALVHDAAAALRTSRPPGSPAGAPSQLPRPTSAVSAPATPSGPARGVAVASSSLPTSPLDAPSVGLGAVPRLPRATSSDGTSGYPPEYRGILADVPDELKPLVTEQLISRDRLAAVVAAEREKLEALEQEVELLNQELSPEEYERQLNTDIYKLQLECDRLAEEVDRVSGSRVPLGETSEEFYQNIYTGQQFVPTTPRVAPPPLPSEPPAWQPQPQSSQDEPEGPPWLCSSCTFGNHPLMQKCEYCDTPRVVVEGTANRPTSFRNFPSTSR